jgi:putative NADPH-quinone reductase
MSSVVLAISGSLRKPSFTEKMLELCLDGMGEGLEVHRFHPHAMKIGPCTSCWSCWSQNSPGECVQDDDFQEILDVYKRADYFLLAAPLYVFDLPATVKNVLDRFFIALEPAQIELSGGMTQHPKRFPCHPKAVLISSCGFPESENFDLLKRHFSLICEHMDWPLAGEILISAAGCANVPGLFEKKYEWIRTAGAELVREKISPETMEKIAAPVMPAEDYRKLVSLSFEGGVIAKAKMVAVAIKALRNQKKAN